jgi:predicted transcriptional regulator
MKNLVRGGQTSIHSLRMTMQLFLTIWKILLFATIFINIFNLLKKYDLFSFKELLILQFSRVLVFCGFENYNIIRIGNITWGSNPNTFINYIKNKKKKGEPVQIKDEYKYIIDKDQLVLLTDNLPLIGQNTLCVFGRMAKVAELI